MNKIKDSDLNPTMLATFDNIIKQILSSNLNFQIQISPFSANISLKKTPIKDKLGAPMNPLRPALPSSFYNVSIPDLATLSANNIQDLDSLRRNHKHDVRACEAAFENPNWS